MLRLAKIQLEVLLATVLKVRKVFTGDQVHRAGSICKSPKSRKSH